MSDRLFVTSLMSPPTDPFVQALASLLDRQMSRPVRWLGGSWRRRLTALADGTAHIGWVCGLLHASRGPAWPLEPLAAPVMADARYRRRPVYFSDVVVARASNHRRLSDLAGTVFAYNERGSLSGYQAMLHWLGRHGHALDFFSGLERTGSHVASFEAVSSGRADCAAIDSVLVEMARRRALIDLDGTRVIARLGPYPAPPLVLSCTVDPGTRRELSAVLTGSPLAGDDLLSSWGVEGFSVVDERDYRPLRPGHAAGGRSVAARS